MSLQHYKLLRVASETPVSRCWLLHPPIAVTQVEASQKVYFQAIQAFVPGLFTLLLLVSDHVMGYSVLGSVLSHDAIGSVAVFAV